MRLLRALAWVVAVISLAASAHVVSAFVRPSGGADQVRAQVRWLNDARRTGRLTGCSGCSRRAPSSPTC
ncbi:MAG: hypothetical protein R2719_08715 [Micropruina sp.]